MNVTFTGFVSFLFRQSFSLIKVRKLGWVKWWKCNRDEHFASGLTCSNRGCRHVHFHIIFTFTHHQVALNLLWKHCSCFSSFKVEPQTSLDSVFSRISSLLHLLLEIYWQRETDLNESTCDHRLRKAYITNLFRDKHAKFLLRSIFVNLEFLLLSRSVDAERNFV